MIEVQIYIPTADNNGQVFDAAHHDAFEQFALSLFGGLSLQPGSVSGAWVNGGAVYRDQMRVYTVRANGLIAHGEALRDLAGFAKAHYAQLAVYVRYLGVSEIV